MAEQDFSEVAMRNNIANQYQQNVLTGGGSGASSGAGLPEIFSGELPMPKGLAEGKQSISPLLSELKIFQQTFEALGNYLNNSLSPGSVFGNISPPGLANTTDLKKMSLFSSRG